MRVEIRNYRERGTAGIQYRFYECGRSGGLPLLGAFSRLMRTHPCLRGRAEPRPPSATAAHAAAGSRGVEDQRFATSYPVLPLPGPCPGRGPGNPVAAVGSGSFPVIHLVLTRVVLTARSPQNKKCSQRTRPMRAHELPGLTRCGSEAAPHLGLVPRLFAEP